MELSSIRVSLSCGVFFDKKQLIFVYIGVVFSLLLSALGILSIIVFFRELDGLERFTLTAVSVVGLVMFTVFLCLILKNMRLKKRILLWLEDAVARTAHSNTIGIYNIGLFKAVKIQVKFNHESKKHVHSSTARVFGGQDGYLGVLNKYTDKEIKILYSPKYDEVLILKE